jgi:glycosyltransferase involved in cell wall biosynthesis
MREKHGRCAAAGTREAGTAQIMDNSYTGSPDIIVISHEFPPLGGGAGQNLSRLCTELCSRGISLCVWTIRCDSREAGGFPFPIKQFGKTRDKRFETSLVSMMMFCASVLWQSLWARKSRPRLILSNMAIPAGICGGLLSRRLGVPHAIWHNGSDVHGGRCEGAGFLQRCILKAVWRTAGNSLFISESLKACALKYAAVRGAGVLPVALSLPECGDRQEKMQEKLFLFAGRLEPVKNPLLFVDAAGLFISRRKTFGARFLMVGSGSLRRAVVDRMERLGLSEQFELRHALPQNELFSLYQNSFVFVIPSVVEGFPTSVIEAGWFSVPSIGSDTPGIRDSIVNGKTGLLFNFNDPLSLCLAMERLAAEPDLQKKLGEAAHENAQLYSAANAAEKFIGFAGPLLRRGS